MNIQTQGLTGRLTGNIAVRSGYDAITRATGELSIEEGKYVAYAHNMDIRRGRLIFTGGPVDRPQGSQMRVAARLRGETARVRLEMLRVGPSRLGADYLVRSLDGRRPSHESPVYK